MPSSPAELDRRQSGGTACVWEHGSLALSARSPFQLCPSTRTRTRMPAHTHMHTCTHVQPHTCVCPRTLAHMHEGKHTHTRQHTLIRTGTDTSTHIPSLGASWLPAVSWTFSTYSKILLGEGEGAVCDNCSVKPAKKDTKINFHWSERQEA